MIRSRSALRGSRFRPPYPFVKIGVSSSGASDWNHRAAALLEVVVSISILLVAMGVVGLTVRNSADHLERTERINQGMLMTEKLLTEVETGALDIRERELGAYFGANETIPGMSWRMVTEPDGELPGLLRISIQILNGDPNGPEEGRQLVLETHVLRAEPKGIDFEKDFGFDEDQVAELTDVLPGGEALFDPTDFDPRSITGLPMDTLMEILPQLLASFGIVLSSGQMEQLLDAASRGDMSLLQGMAGTVGHAAQVEELRKERAEQEGEEGDPQAETGTPPRTGQPSDRRQPSDRGERTDGERPSRFGQGNRRPDRRGQDSSTEQDEDERSGVGGSKPRGRPR